MDLANQLSAFYGSLAEFKATDDVSENLADVFDALLEAAKAAQPDNPVVTAIKPTSRGMYGGVIEKAGDLRTLARQMMTAIA